MADRDESTCACLSWCREYGVGLPGERHHRNCEHWHREIPSSEVIQTRRELIVIGSPHGDESHNCDAMGCTSLSHVLFRFPLTPGVKGNGNG